MVSFISQGSCNLSLYWNNVKCVDCATGFWWENNDLLFAVRATAAQCCRECPLLFLFYNVLWGHRKPVCSVLPGHSLLFLSRTVSQCSKCSITRQAANHCTEEKSFSGTILVIILTNLMFQYRSEYILNPQRVDFPVDPDPTFWWPVDLHKKLRISPLHRHAILLVIPIPLSIKKIFTKNGLANSSQPFK